jgi:hypothetical protein
VWLCCGLMSVGVCTNGHINETMFVLRSAGNWMESDENESVFPLLQDTLIICIHYYNCTISEY